MPKAHEKTCGSRDKALIGGHAAQAGPRVLHPRLCNGCKNTECYRVRVMDPYLYS